MSERVRHPTLEAINGGAVRVYQAEDHLPCVALYPRADGAGRPAILLTCEARSMCRALAKRRNVVLMCVGGVLRVEVTDAGATLSIQFAICPSAIVSVTVPEDRIDRLKEMVLACGVDER